MYNVINMDYQKLLVYYGVYRFEGHIFYTTQDHEVAIPYFRMKKGQ